MPWRRKRRKTSPNDSVREAARVGDAIKIQIRGHEQPRGVLHSHSTMKRSRHSASKRTALEVIARVPAPAVERQRELEGLALAFVTIDPNPYGRALQRAGPARSARDAPVSAQLH